MTRERRRRDHVLICRFKRLAVCIALTLFLLLWCFSYLMTWASAPP